MIKKIKSWSSSNPKNHGSDKKLKSWPSINPINHGSDAPTSIMAILKSYESWFRQKNQLNQRFRQKPNHQKYPLKLSPFLANITTGKFWGADVYIRCQFIASKKRQ